MRNEHCEREGMQIEGCNWALLTIMSRRVFPRRSMKMENMEEMDRRRGASGPLLDLT